MLGSSGRTRGLGDGKSAFPSAVESHPFGLVDDGVETARNARGGLEEDFVEASSEERSKDNGVPIPEIRVGRCHSVRERRQDESRSRQNDRVPAVEDELVRFHEDIGPVRCGDLLDDWRVPLGRCGEGHANGGDGHDQCCKDQLHASLLWQAGYGSPTLVGEIAAILPHPSP